MPPIKACAIVGCSNSGARNDNKFVQCFGGCERWFHWKCVNLNATIATACRDISGLYWFCEECKANSNFYLHTKVDSLLLLVETVRQEARRMEQNLESKLSNCFDMIFNLAKANYSSANEQLLAKSYSEVNTTPHVQQTVSMTASDSNQDNNEITALDLSTNVMFSDELEEPSFDAASGKRKLIEDASASNKRSKITDSETDTCISSQAVVLNPGRDEDTGFPGNITYGICPTEAGQDTAPSIDVSSTLSATTNTTMAPYVATTMPSHQAIVSSYPVAATLLSVTGNDKNDICPAVAGLDSAPLIDLSSSSNIVEQTVPCGSTTVDNSIQAALPSTIESSHHPATNATFVRPPTATATRGIIPIGTDCHTSQPNMQNPVFLRQTNRQMQPVPADSIVVTGNAYNSICPSEARMNTAPLINTSSRSRYAKPQTVTLPANGTNHIQGQPVQGVYSAPRMAKLPGVFRQAYAHPAIRPPAQASNGYIAPYWYIPQESLGVTSFGASQAVTRINTISSNGTTSTRTAAPVLLPPQAPALKQFYVKPFDPTTTVDDITSYIHYKTGWNLTDFSCHRLASDSKSSSRRRTFVSFRVATIDNPSFTNVISNQSFWPDFVSIVPFTLRRK